eukprot:871101_1
MSTLAFKRLSNRTYKSHKLIKHSISNHHIKPYQISQTTTPFRNCNKFPFKIHQLSFHSSHHPRALPLVPAILTAVSKPTAIFFTKILIKFGRPLFLGFRWIWFFIPRRFRSKIETFFHHRFFNKYSRWNFFAFLSTLYALACYSYFQNIEEVPYSFRRRSSYMKMQDLYEESIQEAQG